MWPMIPSLESLVQTLAPAFSEPSFQTHTQLVLAWVLCLGRHRLQRVGACAHADVLPDHSGRHGLDTLYNFFERSAWTPGGLAYRLAVLIVTRLRLDGCITLLVDDTLAHKRGRSVWGLGWFRDAVASTQKRVATASGHNWVVVAVAVCLPGTTAPILALPLLAQLHLPGKAQRSCPELARLLVAQVLTWFPQRHFILVGDGAYASKRLLRGLDERLTFVGRLRGDAALYDPRVPPARAGRARALQALGYAAVWPTVLGLRPVRVVVVRDPEGRMRDAYLFTTDLQADLGWVITQFAWRWSIEVLFRASKQVLEIEAPHHWARSSVEKVAPWVWSLQSVIMVWYISAGQTLPEAEEWRARMGAWDSEWSLRHMIQVLRAATLNATINLDSANVAELRELAKTLKNWANLAA
jgi:DDE superfamily endonuclease